MVKMDKNGEGTQKWKLKHGFIRMSDYERYMYKLVCLSPQLSTTFSASASPDAALPLTSH